MRRNILLSTGAAIALFVFGMGFGSTCSAEDAFVPSPWKWVSPIPVESDLHSLSIVDSLYGWIGGNNGLIMKTTDGGENWTVGQFWNEGTVFGLKFINRNVGWATSGNKIFKSINGGSTWKTIFQTDSNFYFGSTQRPMSSFPDENHGWVFSKYGSILSTSNGGRTWDSSSISGMTFLSFYDSLNGIAQVSGEMWHTNNGGASWLVGTPRIYSEPICKSFFINKNRGWVAGYYYLYRTEDGGKTWKYANIGGGTVADVNFFDSLNGALCNGTGSIYITSDGGASWTQRHKLLWDSTKSERLSSIGYFTRNKAFCIGGVHATNILGTDDGGLTWYNKYPADKPDYGTISFSNGNSGCLGGGGISNFLLTSMLGIMWTRDAGITWQPSSVPASAYIYDISLDSDGNGWAVGDTSQVWRTSDTGKTWQAVQFDTSVSLTRIAYSRSNEVWVQSEFDGMIYKIKNRTLQKDKIHLGYGFEACFADSLYGWAAADSEKIIMTTDGGKTWTISSPSGASYINTPWLMDVACLGRNLVCAVGDNFIFASYDGGISWNKTPVNRRLNSISMYDSLHWVAVGENGFILLTNDGGTTWQNQTVPTYGNLFDVVMTGPNSAYAAGNRGIILRLGESSSPIATSKPSNSLNHPKFAITLNQVAKGFRISFPIQEESRITITLFNVSGRAINTIYSANQKPGVYTNILSTHNIPTGRYFIVAKIGEGRKQTTLSKPAFITH